jgi:CubicO group peptidase (beta-lactamase class C family)
MPDFTVASALHGTLEAVTIRRLMTHYSGLRTEHPLTDWDAPSFPTQDVLLNGLAAIEVVIPQDSQWKYSNLGVGLLGYVIEHVSDVPYERYVYEEITAPLGLENTTFELESGQSLLKATGYSHPAPGSDEIRESPYAPLRGIAAAGQLHSNVEDLAKWMSFQFTSGRSTHSSRVLTASTLSEMHRPVYMSENWLSGQAIGWRMSRRGDLVLHNHGGGIQGFASNMVFSVKARTGVIVLANIWPAPTVAVLSEDIAEFVIQELGPVPEKLQTDLHPLSEDRARAYLGHYWAEPGIYVDVLYQDGELSLVSPRETDYSLHSPTDLQVDPSVGARDSFTVVGGRGAGELAEFSLDDSDKAKAFRLGGFLYRRVD